MSIEPGGALGFALQGLFYFSAIRFATLLAVAANLPNDASREAELRWRLEHLDRWPAYVFTVAWLVYFAAALDQPMAWIAFAVGLSLVPVLWKKRFGRYDYGPSLAAYADGRAVYRRQIAWLSAASIFGMVLLFDLV
jgi:hypothetical protein